MTDKRKFNGGARKGSGAKPIDPSKRKVSLGLYVQSRYLQAAREKCKKILEQLNSD